jgi:hypothetical protein
MHRFLTKALWTEDTSVGSRGARRFANNFEKIFEMLWMRLIGRKSPTAAASTFFGRRIMFAEFKD